MAVPEAFPQANMSREKPAPATTKSIPSSIAVITIPLKSWAATMAFIPIIPFGASFLAKRISYLISSYGMPEMAIRPIPPSFATAAAKRAVDKRIAMPP